MLADAIRRRGGVEQVRCKEDCHTQGQTNKHRERERQHRKRKGAGKEEKHKEKGENTWSLGQDHDKMIAIL